MIKEYLKRMYIDAALLNDENVIQAVADFGPYNTILDVGCWDGIKTLKMATVGCAKSVYGIEPIKKASTIAKKNGINTFEIYADNEVWPIKKSSIDCVISNQVVEHLTDLDHYFREASKVLKSGGYLITSTNNLSSWHNIGSLIFGFTPFDLTNSSSKERGIGNPIAVHRNEQDERGSSWTHKCIYTSRWLKDWQSLYGLTTLKIYGAGYYPFPSKFGKIFPLHSAFITLVAQKK